MASPTANYPFTDAHLGETVEREARSSQSLFERASNADADLDRATVRALLTQLREDEIRVLAESIVVAALDALRENQMLILFDVLGKWLASAEEVVSSRQRMDGIVQAREEGKRRFGRRRRR